MAGEGKARFDRTSRFKQQVYLALEDLSGAHGLARVVGVGLFVLIVLNALLVFVDSNPGVPYALSQVFLAFGLASSVCFGVEYLARLWVADLAHAGLSPLRARARYALGPWALSICWRFCPVCWCFLFRYRLRRLTPRASCA